MERAEELQRHDRRSRLYTVIDMHKYVRLSRFVTGCSLAVTLLSLLHRSYSPVIFSSYSVYRGYPAAFVIQHFPGPLMQGQTATYFTYSIQGFLLDIGIWFIVGETLLFGVLNRPVRHTVYLLGAAAAITVLTLLNTDVSMLGQYEGFQVGFVNYGFPFEYLTVFYPLLGNRPQYYFGFTAAGWDLLIWFGVSALLYANLRYFSSWKVSAFWA